MKLKKILLLLIVVAIDTLIFGQEYFTSFWDRVEKRKYLSSHINETFKFIAKRDTESLYFQQYSQRGGVPIKATSEVIVKCEPSVGKGKILPFENYGFEAYKDDEQLICSMKDFALKGKTWIPNIITNNEWCMKYHYDVLKSRSRDTLSKYEWWIDIFDEKLRDDFYVDNGGESASVKSWWQKYTEEPKIIITDCCVAFHGFFYFYLSDGYVIDSFDNKIKIKWILTNYEYSFIDAFESIKVGQESTLEYYLDGDFLTIILDGTKIELAKKCDDFDTQWESLIQNDYCSLDNIIWPHHADGTSEYEDTIRYPEPVVIEEPEEIEIEEYVDETENSDNQLEKQQTRLEWLKENDPERYELEMYEIECMHKRERREKILKIVISSSIVFVVFGIIFIILKKKKKSAK